MSDKETPREDNAAAAAEETRGAEESPKRADLCHGRYVEWFRQSLVAEGERTYQRWGLPLYHSLSDEEVEAQRTALGFEAKDALDHYNRGCLLAAREEFGAAAKAFDKAAQMDPELAEAVFNRALALERAGEQAKARETWKAYLERFGETDDAGEVKEHLSAPSA